MIEFSENLRIVTLKLFELTPFLSPNVSIYRFFTLILHDFGGPLRSKAIFRAQSIYREVYGLNNENNVESSV